jgi:hypothetical protein
MSPRSIDISGQRFGRLLVIDMAGVTASRSAVWRCVCDCGRTKNVSGKNLRSGESQSCGCLGKERRAAGTKRAKTTHGETAGPSNSRTYRIWTNMISRCTNPKFDAYPWYGGRGIAVCERWRTFPNFLADMGRAPEGMTLDRTESSGDYEPGNCRWATKREQANNKRNNRVIEWRGERLTQAQWAERVGLDQKLISARLIKGWSVEAALCTPPMSLRKSA